MNNAFCCFLKDYVGQFVRIGVVCNCDTNNHIYRDGYITRDSLIDKTVSLYSAPIGGTVIFATACENIFEIYLFGTISATTPNTQTNIISISEMEEQKRNLVKNVLAGTFVKEG